VSLNAEGDTSIREDTLEGLGTPNFFNALFGSIMNIATPPSRSPPELKKTPPLTLPPIDETTMAKDQVNSNPPKSRQKQQGLTAKADEVQKKSSKWMLIDVLPDPGYFAAGAVAGVASRTLTAPLDRLKVFLIANVDAPKAPLVDAAAKGNAKEAMKLAGRPLILATKELWKAGGMRSLFAGMSHSLNIYNTANRFRKWSQCHEGYARISY